MSRRFAYLLVCCIALPQCGQSESARPSAPEHAVVSVASPGETPNDPRQASPSRPDIARICRAALAALNGHDPSIMNVTVNTGDLVQLRYARPSDGKIWTNECRIEETQVILRTVEAFGPGSGTGRWLTSPGDEVITYSQDGRSVSITTQSPDGSSSSETYAMDEAS